MLLNPLFEKAFLFTINGLIELGAATTLDAYPAFKATETNGPTYNPSILESIITTVAPFASATLTASVWNWTCLTARCPQRWRKILRGFEPRSLDSESRVLTVTR